MKQKIKILIIALALMFTSVISLGCGNRMWLSDSVKNEIHYVLVKEVTGEVHLHEINKWADSESESAMFTTKCCNNYIWTSANNATFYKEKPKHIDSSKYIICEG